MTVSVGSAVGGQNRGMLSATADLESFATRQLLAFDQSRLVTIIVPACAQLADRAHAPSVHFT